MLYRVSKITDLNHNKRTEPDVVARLGRILKVEPKDIKIGKKALLECVLPNYWKSFITTPVKKVDKTAEGIVITTLNSVYYLVEIGDDDI